MIMAGGWLHFGGIAIGSKFWVRYLNGKYVEYTKTTMGDGKNYEYGVCISCGVGDEVWLKKEPTVRVLPYPMGVTRNILLQQKAA